MWPHITQKRSIQWASVKPNKGSRVKPCGRPVSYYMPTRQSLPPTRKQTLTLMACWVQYFVAKDAEIGQSLSSQLRSLSLQIAKQILSVGKTRERNRQTLLFRHFHRTEFCCGDKRGKKPRYEAHLAADFATSCDKMIQIGLGPFPWL